MQVNLVPSRLAYGLFMLCLLASTLGKCLVASDWPQFLGVTRNGVCAEDELSLPWPKEGPPFRWKKKIGQGFSSPVVADGKLILFHRSDNKEVIECLSAKTGTRLWMFDYPTAYRDDFGFDEGPRATPAINDGKVYTFGAEGALHCLDFNSGKRIWSVYAQNEFKASKGFFGLACSPLVEGNAVLLNIGGAEGSGIVAFDCSTGKLLWKATSAEASYSSPVAATIDGKRYGLFFTRSGLAGLDPATGKVQFDFPWRSRAAASVNAATPLVIDDLIFLSASYETGAVLLRVKDNKAEKLWAGDDILSNHYATSVYLDGFLYGFDGRQEYGPRLRCVEFKTGKIRWSENHFGAGTVTLAGRRLLVLSENGELLVAPATPDRFKSVASAHVLPNGVRAYPAVADGCLYARSKETLVSVDLRSAK
jgi:outer membrane protein assembly factor BamB